MDSVDEIAARDGAIKHASVAGPPDMTDEPWVYSVERMRWERPIKTGGVACIVDHEKAVDPNATHVPPIFISVRHPETNEEIREAPPHG